MNTKDGFTISAFKMLLSVVSLAIMLPMVDDLTNISFYVTVNVYVLGKFIDLVSKIMERQRKLFFIIYLIGVVIGMIAVGMCFFAFANTDIANGISFTLPYNYILLVMVTAFCFIDIADFVLCICKLNDTKQRLQQFG